MAQQREYTVEEQLTEGVQLRMWWEQDTDPDLSWLDQPWEEYYRDERQKCKKDGTLVSDRYAKGQATYYRNQDQETLEAIYNDLLSEYYLRAEILVAGQVICPDLDGFVWFDVRNHKALQQSRQQMRDDEQRNLAYIREHLADVLREYIDAETERLNPVAAALFNVEHYEEQEDGTLLFVDESERDRRAIATITEQPKE